MKEQALLITYRFDIEFSDGSKRFPGRASTTARAIIDEQTPDDEIKRRFNFLSFVLKF